MYKNILAKLIKDADQPYISKYRDGAIFLTLPAMGDPYYEVSCMLTAEEADELLNAFPEFEVHNV
jgi:hypothetical protein